MQLLLICNLQKVYLHRRQQVCSCMIWCSVLGRSGVSSPLLGLGLPYQRPELKESFSLYLDYLVYCLADPDYEAKVDADRQQRRAYLPAVKKIEEEELATWRCI